MNLKEIREEINAALDYNPDLQQYKDMTARVVNRHYQQVSSQYHWLFMQKRVELTLRADIDGSATDTMTFSNSRKGVLPTGAGTSSVKLLPSDVEGALFVVNNVEYEITRRIDERTIVINQSLNGTFTDWTIKFKRYALPRDCVEVLGIMDRGIAMTETLSYTDVGNASEVYTSTQTTTAPNKGRFTFLDARKEEFLYLDRSDTGDPFVSIEEMHSDVFPPDMAPSLTTAPIGASSELARGATYDYCYTYLYAGRESAPSPVATVTLGAGTAGGAHIVELTKLMDTRANRPAGDKDTGRLKKIYRRCAKLDSSVPKPNQSGFGSWRHIATLEEDDTDYTDDGKELTSSTFAPASTTVSATIDVDGVLYDLTQLNEIGPHQYIRLWYTPTSDYKVEARYLTRPHRLVNDADEPRWPAQYHHLLVYMALRDICMQHGMLNHSQIYEGRSGPLLERMKSKYLSRSDRMYVRRGFDRAVSDKERWGIPSKS